jgi:16S rRNA (adenine1518-N6/adenine1519-N6)-dimethyltransferase
MAYSRQQLPPQKKHLGQHFLISQTPINRMLSTIPIDANTTIVEIGCGNGILTRALLETKCKALHVVEIDADWANHIFHTIQDPRLTIHHADALTFDFKPLKGDGRLVLMANLPYLITFPLFAKIVDHYTLFDDGMVMIQDEAAERIAHTTGRRFGAVSMFLQHSLTFTLSDTVPPSFFSPPPKVMSRLMRFQPKTTIMPIQDPDTFWAFVYDCFKSPRQTLGNNLKRTPHAWHKLSPQQLQLRAQQLSQEEMYTLWQEIGVKDQI